MLTNQTATQQQHHCRIAGRCPGIINCWQTSLWPQLVRPSWPVHTTQEELASQCNWSQTEVWETTSQLWRHSNSLHSQFQTDQVDDYRTSFLVAPQPYPPQRPIPWAQLSPQSTGTKDAGSSPEDLICNHSERSRPSLASPTATMCTRPYNTYTNLPNYSNKIDQTQRTAARWSSPRWSASLWHLLHFAPSEKSIVCNRATRVHLQTLQTTISTRSVIQTFLKN